MFRSVCIPMMAGILASSMMAASADDSLKAPNITDAKLGSMRYGGESIVYWVERMKDGDKQRAEKLRGDLNKLRARMERIKGSDASQVKKVQTYFAAIEKAIVAKANGGKVRAQPAQAQSTKSSQTQPTVAMTGDQASQFVAAVQAKYQNHGTVQLPEIRRLLNDKTLSEAEVDNVLSQYARYQAEVEKDLPLLKQVVAETGEGDYWLRWISGESMKAYQQEIRILKSSLDNHITRASQDAANRSQLDVEKHNFQFRGDAAMKTLARFDEAIAMIDQAARLEKIFGLDGHWSNQKADLVKNAAAYRAKVEQVDSGKSTTLPKEVVNPELRRIAETVLKKEKYGVGKWERLIVNTKLMPRERIEHKVFSGKLETIVRKWEEYQVTTVEKDKNGKLYIYHNMIAKFSRAPQTTPIGEWILSKRFKGNAIAVENLK